MKLYLEIEKSFAEIENFFNEEDLKEFMNGDYSDLFYYHFGLGIYIRSALLQDDSELFNMFIDKGIFLKDDMSSLILKLFFIYVQEKYKK